LALSVSVLIWSHQILHVVGAYVLRDSCVVGANPALPVRWRIQMAMARVDAALRTTELHSAESVLVAQSTDGDGDPASDRPVVVIGAGHAVLPNYGSLSTSLSQRAPGCGGGVAGVWGGGGWGGGGVVGTGWR